MITIDGLSVSLGNKPILQNLNFSVADRTLTAVMGPSGCGKSTLLKALMGLAPCTSGEIKVDLQSTASLTTWTVRQTLFGLVPQAPLLLPWKNAIDNILAAAPRELGKNEARERALHLLEKVELRHAEKLFPWQASQGMAARISLARSLMMKNRVLLLDEPFAAIDATTRFNLQRWLLELVENLGQAAVLVTHDPREALLLADEILVLNGQPARIHSRFTTPARSVRRDEDWIFGTQAGELEKQIRQALEKTPAG